MKIAYLSNLYPKTSHSFIRREILALESLGVAVSRYTIRVWDQEIIDAIDQQELTKTRVILQAGFLTLLANCLKTV
ncbi:MAG: hypothetical protein RLZZ568_202, partial [Cyanobacteriota bacterium]